MARPAVKIRYGGIGKLLRSAEVAEELRKRAERIAAAAGPGHRVEVSRTGSRARAAVITDTYYARRAEAKQRRLTAAVAAGRGA